MRQKLRLSPLSSAWQLILGSVNAASCSFLFMLGDVNWAALYKTNAAGLFRNCNGHTKPYEWQ